MTLKYTRESFYRCGRWFRSMSPVRDEADVRCDPRAERRVWYAIIAVSIIASVIVGASLL